MRDVYWEWFCSLFPSYKSEDIDPYTWVCHCGRKWKFNRIQLLRMYLFKNYIYTCPQCQRQGTFRMLCHVVRDIDSDEVKQNNRMIE